MEENKVTKIDNEVNNKKIKLDKKTLLILVIVIIVAIIIAVLGIIDSVNSIIKVHQENESSYIEENSNEIKKIYSEIKK